MSTGLICGGHTRPVPHLHFSPNTSASSTTSKDPSYLLISSCKDGKPMLRDWLGDWLGTFIGHKGAVWSSKLSRDGQRAATGSGDFLAKVWDTITGEEILSLTHHHIVRTVDLSADSSKLLTGGNEKKLRIWDLSRSPSPASLPDSPSSLEDNVQELTSTEAGSFAHSATIRSAFWDEPRQAVVSYGEDKMIRFWDLRTLKETHSIKYDQGITSMEKSQDGELMSITGGNTVSFLRLDTRDIHMTHQLAYAPSTASLHPIHRNTFVTGSVADGWVRVHSTETGEEREVGKGHHGPVHCVSYSPDGELYASGSEDGTVRLWQTTPKDYGLWRYNP